MPQAVPAIIKAIGWIIAAKGVTAFIVRTIIMIGISMLISKRMAPKARFSDFAQAIHLNSRDTLAVARTIYGQTRVGGLIFFLRSGQTGLGNTFPGTNDYLYYAIELCDHLVDGITDIYFDDRIVTPAMLDGDGDVTSGPLAGFVTIQKFLGTDNQTVSTLLGGPGGPFSLDWTADCRARGHAYIAVRLLRDSEDQEANQKVWPNGAPNAITAVVRGKRIYDPRLDTTVGGSGPQRLNDPTTWAWSRNLPLCARDFLTWSYGFAEDPANINLSELVAAANRADELVEFPATPSNLFQAKYTCDGPISSELTLSEIKEYFEACMAGKIFYSQGEWHIFAGGYETPTIQLGESDFAGPISYQTTAPHDERFNEIRAAFLDRLQHYTGQECLPRFNSSYQTDDGEYLPITIDLPLTHDEFTSQYICFLMLQNGRNFIEFTATMKPTALRLRIWDTVQVTVGKYSWANKVFRVMHIGFNMDGQPEITFKEDFATRYDWVAANATARTITNPFANTDELPPPPISLRATGLRNAVKLDWSNPSTSTFEYCPVYFNTSNDFTTASVIARVKASTYTHMTMVPGFYWVTTVNRYGNRPATATPTNTTGIAGRPILDDTFFDEFDHQDWASYYNNRANGAGVTIDYPANGENGGRVLRATGGRLWIAFKQNIPFDPNALYRISAKVRRTLASSDGNNENVYIGVEGVAADGTTLVAVDGSNSSGSQHYIAASGYDTGVDTLGTWREFKGYFRGLGTTPVTPSNNVHEPSVLRSGVTYIRPLLILNYNDGNGQQECDYIKVEKLVVPDDSSSPDKTKLVGDPEFAFGAAWWTVSGTGISFSTTGGSAEGVCSFTFDGTAKSIRPKRLQPPLSGPQNYHHVVVNGMAVQVWGRWRRRSAITNSSPGTPGMTFSVSVRNKNNLNNFGCGSFQIEPELATLDAWNDFTFTAVIANVDPSLGVNRIYLGLTASAAANLTAGQVDLEFFRAEFVAGRSSDLKTGIITETVSFTLAPRHQGNHVICDSTSTISVTINQGSLGEDGRDVLLSRRGTGAVTLVAGSGVTINSKSGLNIAPRHGRVWLQQVTLQTFDAGGDLAT